VNVVLDPVLRSSSGAELIDAKGVGVIRARLLPLCTVITPNVEEVVELTESGPISSSESWDRTLPQLRAAAAKLHKLGCRGVVITGGHLAEPNDYLSVWDSDKATDHVFPGSRLESQATHGTGCAFSTALACGLAHGQALLEAVSGAKNFVRNAIAAAYPVGRGVGPMNHLFRLQERR
jgi:hydroxymethylpyrimidine/phosphomethylpyrimidine kinase